MIPNTVFRGFSVSVPVCSILLQVSHILCSTLRRRFAQSNLRNYCRHGLWAL